MARCFQVSAADNVATMLDDVEPGICDVVGGSDSGESGRMGTAGAPGSDSGESEWLRTAAAPGVVVTEPIKIGHKVALVEIALGEAVVKFGVPIGRATVEIGAGQWVHLHNCASFLDERSQTFDVHSGATTDTVYE